MIHVAIIGAGHGGSSLIEILYNDPLVKIVGVADRRRSAPGLLLARRLKIPVTTDYRRLLRLKDLNLVIDVTGNPEVEGHLHRLPRKDVAVIGGVSAKFMWQLIEERIKSRKEREKHLIKEARHALVEERTRIALDIHDGLIQNLVGLHYKLDLCEELVNTRSPFTESAFKETRTLLKTTIEEARGVVFNLKPLQLEKVELIPALKNYLRSFERQTHLRTDLKVKGEEEKIPSRAKASLFRIIQEALSNVHRHAKATRAQVELTIDKQAVDLKIIDNGVGFDPGAIWTEDKQQACVGLKGIAERAKLIGGSAEVWSESGKGTVVIVHLPRGKRGGHEKDQGLDR